MGNLILSRPAEIKRPYYVSELGVHLYSAEELCYYIYHNAVLIDDYHAVINVIQNSFRKNSLRIRILFTHASKLFAK